MNRDDSPMPHFHHSVAEATAPVRDRTEDDEAADIASAIVSRIGFARKVSKALAAHAIQNNTDEHLERLLRASASIAHYANILDKDYET